ncbi:hypothetical protein JIN84_12815 [Luteolibacter yonseiensis]|uniref:Uncharacterized protein n=1 Tax=Luteolibacter yonseiensis TaxID=1144680 RepID=A0A934VBU9_9BACT|nr:hypothetical protein [Luteolibacter yonseiensis]MBK1816500.1 hypothetical protein [Luteolibacter yonseiensis]
MTHDLPNIRAAASLWRVRHPDQAHCSIVVQISHAGMHAAIGSTLTPIASNFAPGTYIVNPDASLQVASGGSLDSAEAWETLEPADRAAAFRFTGGPLSEEQAAEHHALRALLMNEPNVHDVIAIAPHLDGRWMYLVQCPLSWKFPTHVVGIADLKNEEAEIIAQCGALWSAQDVWNNRRHPLSHEEG